MSHPIGNGISTCTRCGFKLSLDPDSINNGQCKSCNRAAPIQQAKDSKLIIDPPVIQSLKFRNCDRCEVEYEYHHGNSKLCSDCKPLRAKELRRIYYAAIEKKREKPTFTVNCKNCKAEIVTNDRRIVHCSAICANAYQAKVSRDFYHKKKARLALSQVTA